MKNPKANSRNDRKLKTQSRDHLKRVVRTNGSFNGSRFVKAGPIIIGCISPEARDCLDRVMEEWAKHKKSLRNTMGKHYRPSAYGFAYWLIRWSGLVRPNDKLSHGGGNEQ